MGAEPSVLQRYESRTELTPEKWEQNGAYYRDMGAKRSLLQRYGSRTELTPKIWEQNRAYSREIVKYIVAQLCRCSREVSHTSSETDRRDNPSGSNSFLGQRRRRQPQRRRGPGGVNERRDADFYRVTRSQSFSKLRQDIEAHKLHTSTNLSAPDFQALQTLRNDKDIIIKPADKGGAIVVMNKSDYTKEIHRQLHDDTVYRLLPADPTTMIRNFIKETLDPYVEKGVIDGKT
ncbi:unnamed protein product [Ranitomeya imitator]|uniref:Uncharacterized protein n=1 Tax=Ranitomeya imitator TaxID=111125 RepID=A0ABN9KZ77_9NEOB|nr:unnamed protein product [Ranitomeya imitator]